MISKSIKQAVDQTNDGDGGYQVLERGGALLLECLLCLPEEARPSLQLLRRLGRVHHLHHLLLLLDPRRQPPGHKYDELNRIKYRIKSN